LQDRYEETCCFMMWLSVAHRTQDVAVRGLKARQTISVMYNSRTDGNDQDGDIGRWRSNIFTLSLYTTQKVLSTNHLIS